MFCHCGKQKSYTAAQIDGTFNYDLWVCDNCRKPSRLVFEKETFMNVPFGAAAFLNLVNQGDGRHIHTWRLQDGSQLQTMTFHSYPRKFDMPDQGRNVLLRFWKWLDDDIDLIRSADTPNDHKETLKITASTYADVLAALMSPFYQDQAAVLAESMERWKARQAGAERQSPGLAEAVWDPSTRFDGTPYSEAAERKTRSGGAPAPVRLDDQKRNFIKTMLDSGGMSAATLAGMFEVSTEVIEANYDS